MRNNTITTIPESGKDALTQRELVVPGAIVYIIPIFIGGQRTVIITQDRHHATTLADSDKQVINWDLTLKVKSITVSLIDYVRRREFAVAHVKLASRGISSSKAKRNGAS